MSAQSEEQSKEKNIKIRQLEGIYKQVIKYAAIGFTLFQLYTAFFGLLPHMAQRSIFIGLGLFIMLGRQQFKAKATPDQKIPVYDIILMIMVLAATLYVTFNYQELIFRRLHPTSLEYVLALSLLLIGFEVARRSIGWPLIILALLFLTYGFFGTYFPGTWSHPGIGLQLFVGRMYLGDAGYWGMLASISTRIIAIFYIFGLVVVGVGGGESFIKIGLRLAGKYRGGAAKVATLGSSLMGMISGSGMANAAATGSLTIPMMKRLKYKPEFAAAVEAVSSTGGQIMPPIMGAGAFMMTEITGIPYLTIAVAAIIPAFLFYFGDMLVIDLRARKDDIKPVPSDEIPKWLEAFNLEALLQLIIPVAIIVVFLLRGSSIQFSGTVALGWVLAIFLVVNRKFKIKNKLYILLDIFEKSGYALAGLAALAFVAQIVVSMITITGGGPKFSQLIVSIGGQDLIAVLFLAMGACIILGMGMATTAAYVMSASLVAPALVNLGIPMLTAHMFVFYFAILSTITPPVCTGIYAASTVADIEWTRAVPDSIKLGMVGFIVPFMIIYNPALLLEGSVGHIVMIVLIKMVGITALAFTTIGFIRNKLTIFYRGAFLVGAVLTVSAILYISLIGVAFTAIVFLIYLLQTKDKVGVPEIAKVADEKA